MTETREGLEGAVPVESESENGHGAPASVLDTLKQRHRQLQQDRYLDYPIPGYQEKLVVRFNPAPVDELRRIAKTTDKMKGGNPEFIGATDVLLHACQMVMVKDPEHELADDTGLVPLHRYPELDADEPIRFDERLAQALDLNAKKARGVVWSLFENNYAVMVCYAELMEWQGDTDSAVDRELLGESGAAR